MQPKYKLGDFLGKKNGTKIGQIYSIEITKHLGKPLVRYSTTIGTFSEQTAKLYRVR